MATQRTSKLTFGKLEYLKLKAKVEYVKLKLLAEASMNGLFSRFFEGINTDEVIALLVNKGLFTTATLEDIAEVILTKVLIDDVLVEDAFKKKLIKGINEPVSLKDIQYLYTLKALKDIAGLGDSISLETGKSLADTLGVSDKRTIVPTKGIIEPVPIVEILPKFTFTKSHKDNVSLVEVMPKEFTKFLWDLITVGDQVNAQISEWNSYTDMLFFTEEMYYSVEKALADSLTTGNLLRFGVEKGFQTGIEPIDHATTLLTKVYLDGFSVDSEVSIVPSKYLGDSTTISDGGFVTTNDYCETGYFIEDYVGVNYPF